MSRAEHCRRVLRAALEREGEVTAARAARICSSRKGARDAALWLIKEGFCREVKEPMPGHYLVRTGYGHGWTDLERAVLSLYEKKGKGRYLHTITMALRREGRENVLYAIQSLVERECLKVQKKWRRTYVRD